jgi:hypothetical protein
VRETLKSNRDLGVEPPNAFTTTDPLAAYKHFQPRAQAISSDAIKPCTVDVEVARQNLEHGLQAIEPHLDAIHARLPKLSIPSLLELRALGLALSFATERIASTTEGAIEKHLERLRFMRNLTLRQLEILAYLDLIPEARVQAIRVGPTPIESCREAIAIVALFSEYTMVLTGRHPFTAVQLNELWERARWLLDALRSRSGGVTASWREPATLIRDRYWTLLVDVHDELREAGVALFGLKHLDDHIPPLGRRVVVQSGTRPAVTPPKAATG